MISASSSAASGILTATFGTPKSTTTSPVPALGAGEEPSPSNESPSAAYVLDGSLAGSNAAEAGFLSNAVFAGVTEALLRDPRANGALTGEASSNVKKIISQIGAAEGATAAQQPAATSTTNAATLPTDGIVA